MLPEGKEAAKTQAITLDLSRLPLDEALMLRPMPGSNEATGIGGQDELFYVDWDVEARSLQQAPLEGYQQTYLLHGNEGWQIPERRPVLEDPLMVESTMPMVQVEPETFQVRHRSHMLCPLARCSWSPHSSATRHQTASLIITCEISAGFADRAMEQTKRCTVALTLT